MILFTVMPRDGGAPSNHRTISGYWVAAFAGDDLGGTKRYTTLPQVPRPQTPQ
jgi:hypothetical protein